MLTKTTMTGLNTHNIWREQHTREKAKENRLPPQWAVRDFHHKQEVQAEVSQPGEQLPEHQEGWRQQPWPCSVIEERRKTKKKVYDLSGHETKDCNLIMATHLKLMLWSILSDARVQGGKTC